MLKIYNTLSRSLEEFKPIDPNNVTIYSCGPTVYSRQHLGNLRMAYFIDLLKNILRHIEGYKVTHVMNITDVGHLTGDNEGDADHGEDRMEKGARQQGITARDVADMFTQIYMKDLELLRIDTFEFMPKATDHIAEQISMVQELEKKGYTYIIPGDGVYMDTSKVEDYGVLTNKKNLENIESGSRVQDAGKKNPTDFALWKFNISGKKRDMERESPRGIGFPGRHIECSAMSRKYLGDHIDIHTGGMEHIAIHHTNEICQSECSGAHHPRVNYRIHLQWLMMNGKKIAKSDGNCAFMSDVLDNGYKPEDLRYFFLQAHYRSFQDFNREALAAADSSRTSLVTNMTLRNSTKKEREEDVQEFDYGDRNKKITLQTKQGEEWYQKVINSLLNDINTAETLAHVFTISKLIKKFDLGMFASQDDLKYYKDLNHIIYYLDQRVLKIGIYDHLKTQVIKDKSFIVPADIQELAAQRRQAKLDKNRALADEIRNKLTELGRQMTDSKDDYGLLPTR